MPRGRNKGPRQKYGSVTAAVKEYLKDGPAFIHLIADETGIPEGSVRTALYRGKGELFQAKEDVRGLMASMGEPYGMGRPNLLWSLIDEEAGDIPGCPD